MNQDDIIAKIRSIVRLARRAGTDGERAAAEAAASRLASKHGISLESVDAPDGDFKTGEFDEETWRARTGIEIGFITGILRRHFGVVLMQNTNGRKCRFSWIGTKANVAVAQYVFDILYRECRRAWAEARILKNSALKVNRFAPAVSRLQIAALRTLDKRSFLNGWFSVIHAKLEAHPIRPDVEQFKAEREDAERTLQRMMEENESIRNRTSEKDSQSREAMLMGAQAAEKVNLSHGMGGDGYKGRPANLAALSRRQIGTHGGNA